MKKLLYTLAFALVAVILVGFTGEANAQLVSPVPLDQVFPTVRDSSFGVPGNYNTQGFAFSFTQDIERCDCRGEFNNVGAAAIQMCLNKLGFTVSQSGHGAPGFETNCVGHKTQVALGSFQQYFGFDESSTNHYGEEDSAYAGMITQAIMNHLCYDIMNDNNKVTVDTTQTGIFTGRSGGSRSSVVRDTDPEPEGPSISINKSGPTGNVVLGTEVTYPIVVTNNGDEVLTNVVVTDVSIPGVTIDCGTTYGSGPSPLTLTSSLGIGANASCEVKYTPTALGPFENKANVTADGDTGSVGPVSNRHPVTVVDEVIETPEITLTKTADQASIAENTSGSFSFVVTAVVGNHTNIQIDESQFAGPGTLGAVSCPSTTLNAPNTMNCTVAYNAPADVSSTTTVTNIASVTSTQDITPDQAQASMDVTDETVVACNLPDRNYIGAFDGDLVAKDAAVSDANNPNQSLSGILPLWPGGSGVVPGQNTLQGASITRGTTDSVLGGLVSPAMGFRFAVGQWKDSDTFDGADATDPVCERDIHFRLTNVETGFVQVFQPWANNTNGCEYYKIQNVINNNGTPLDTSDDFPEILYGTPGNANPVAVPTVTVPLPASLVGLDPYNGLGDQWVWDAYYTDTRATLDAALYPDVPKTAYTADSGFKIGAILVAYDTEGCVQ